MPRSVLNVYLRGIASRGRRAARLAAAGGSSCELAERSRRSTRSAPSRSSCRCSSWRRRCRSGREPEIELSALWPSRLRGRAAAMSELVDKLFAIHDSLQRRDLCPCVRRGDRARLLRRGAARDPRPRRQHLLRRRGRRRECSPRCPAESGSTPEDVEQVERDGQARLVWDGVPIDVFLNNLPLHEAVADGGRLGPARGPRGSRPRLRLAGHLQGVLRSHQGLGRHRGGRAGDPGGHRGRGRDDRRARRRGRSCRCEPPDARPPTTQPARPGVERDGVVGDDAAVGVPACASPRRGGRRRRRGGSRRRRRGARRS